MNWTRKGLSIAAICIAAWLGPAPSASADTFDCYNGGECRWQASCSGAEADGYCELQCWVEFECEPTNHCYKKAGQANCGGDLN